MPLTFCETKVHCLSLSLDMPSVGYVGKLFFFFLIKNHLYLKVASEKEL